MGMRGLKGGLIMNITKLIELLPDSVKPDIADFVQVKMKDGKMGTRVLLDRLLTDTEKQAMKSKHFVGLDCVACHRYAPEIKKSYFYVV